MNAVDRDRAQTQFERQGTLSKPGPIGRFARLAWGGFLGFGAVNVAQNWETLIALKTLPHWTFLLIALFTALKVFPYVVTIGLGIDAPYKPLAYGLVALNVTGIGLSWLATGNLWSPILGWFVLIWFLYTLVHLGVSFLLSSVIATPGCEMRAVPHLWSLVTGRETKEHFCPGHIDAVDRWETKLKNP